MARGIPGVGVLPGGSGFPDSYPYAVSGGAPRESIVRPLVQPLYDTEVLAVGALPPQLQFFQRPLGQNPAFLAVPKSRAETNMALSGSLPTPQSFLIAGFTMGVEPGVNLPDFNSVYTGSVFTFTMSGNRTYLEVPSNYIPQAVVPTGFSAIPAAALVAETMVGNGLGVVNNVWKMTCKGQGLKISPNESFGVVLAWPNGGAAITAAAGVRVTVALRGLLFNAV